MRLAAIIFLFFFTSKIFASEAEIHLFSYHSNKVYSNNNYGFGFNQDITNNLQVNVGYYKNSQKHDTFYFGSSYYFLQKKGFKIGFGGILATGYSSYDKNTGFYNTTEENQVCTEGSSGDISCKITKTTKKESYEYYSERQIPIKVIGGLIMEYDPFKNIGLKVMFSSDRALSQNEPTDLVHFSIVLKI